MDRGDGSLDPVVADQGSHTVRLRLGQGNGSFLAPIPLTVNAGPTWLAVAAPNSHGMSILIASADSNQVRVLSSEVRRICGDR